MTALLAVVVGVLYAGGLYLMLRRSLVQLVLGLALLGHAANLLIFTVGRLSAGAPPIVPPGARARRALRRPGAPGADPDGDRHRLRRPGLRARAVQARLPGDRAPTTSTRCGRPSREDPPRPPVLVPLATAIAAPRLPPRRPPSARRASPARWASSPSRPRSSRRVDGAGILVMQLGRLARAVRHQPRRRPLRRDHGRCSPGSRRRRGRLLLGPSTPRARRSASTRSSTCCLMGVAAFLTGDLFNLYVWFEVMLMASFVLVALGGERGQLEGAIKYVTLNLISSALFLAAVGILYGVAGTLNMADLAVACRAGTAPGLVTRSLPLPRGLRDQGGGLPALLLAARLVPHAAGRGVRDLRGAPDEGRRLRARPHLHPRLHWRHRASPTASSSRSRGSRW